MCASTMYHASTKYQNICYKKCTITSPRCVSTCINITKKCTSYMCQICASNHAPNMCLKHVPMPQQYTKDMPQACIITSPMYNPQNMHINIPVTLYQTWCIIIPCSELSTTWNKHPFQIFLSLIGQRPSSSGPHVTRSYNPRGCLVGHQ
jgi:hypothetical protein